MKKICTILCVMLFVVATIPGYGQENTQQMGGITNATVVGQKEMVSIQEGQNNVVEKKDNYIKDIKKNTIFSWKWLKEQYKLNTPVEKIEDYTKDIKKNTSFGISAIVAILTFVFSVTTFIYTRKTYKAQKETMENTKKLTEGAHQKELLIELARHLYKNLIVIRSMRIKTQLAHYKSHPSEAHFQKLKAPMVNFHLDAFYGKNKHFLALHHLYLQFRNYNEEIDVAMDHISDPQLPNSSKEDDFDMLEKRTSFLTGRIADVMTEIWGEYKDNDGNTIKDKNGEIIIDEIIKEGIIDGIDISLGKENETNNDKKEELPANLYPLDEAEFNNSQYARIYTTQKEKNKFINGFNKDVQNRVWKIRMIKFIKGFNKDVQNRVWKNRMIYFK